MAHIDKVSATKRTASGSTACRRLRREGFVPCNVYGHKQEPQPVSMTQDECTALVMSGTKVVDLDVEGSVEKTLVKDVQWDTFSTNVLHVDFMRVDPNERVQVDVPIHLRGTAPGVVAGGVVDQQSHTIQIECLAVELPDFIEVRIGSLKMGQYLHISDLTDLPRGVSILTPPETVLVHIVDPKALPSAQPEEAEEEPAATEPELVGEAEDSADAE